MRPETSSLWASLHEQPWKLQVLLSQWLHLNAWWILCQWVILMSCLLSINTKQIKLQSFHICIYYLFVDSRTCSLAHCQYGCEEVQGEIRCLCPSAGLQLGQDERTCVGEKNALAVIKVHMRSCEENHCQIWHTIRGRPKQEECYYLNLKYRVKNDWLWLVSISWIGIFSAHWSNSVMNLLCGFFMLD